MILVNPVRLALDAQGVALGIGVRAMRSVEVARVMKSAGYDWLFIDLEHGPSSIETVFAIAVCALDVGIAPFVRVPRGDLGLAARCLDSGALGIVMSHVDTAAEARACVEALRFPPLGHRSATGSYVQLGFRSGSTREALAVLERATMIVAMLETPAAIGNAARIAEVEGIDALLIGANDLSVEMGIPGEFDHERIAEAVRTASAACADAGKLLGIGGVNRPDLLKSFIRAGARMVLCGNDLGLLIAAAEERVRLVRASAA